MSQSAANDLEDAFEKKKHKHLLKKYFLGITNLGNVHMMSQHGIAPRQTTEKASFFVTLTDSLRTLHEKDVVDDRSGGCFLDWPGARR
ncbi:hypothetical protein PVFL_17345 [Pseudomonas viridiflava]|nr:hypothetical protein PVFL_17345 [Pseudomonas viridiflava]